MGIRIYAPPTVEPITLADLRTHLGIEPYVVDSNGDGTHPHDDMIMAMLGAAREWAENFTGRSVALKTYELALDTFPSDVARTALDDLPKDEIELPNPPVISITNVVYVDGDLVEQTIDSSDYVLDRNQFCNAYLNPAVGYSWPATARVINAVKVRYLAGYQDPEPESSAPDAETLPGAFRASLLLMVGHLYANRESVADRQTFEVPMGAEYLLRPLRVRKGFA